MVGATFQVGPGCSGTSGLRSASVRGRGRALAIDFVRRLDAPVRAEVFQVSLGRRVVRERLVARLSGLTTWSGTADSNGRPIGDGFYFVRLRIPLGRRGVDAHRLVAQRSGGRWVPRPGFYARPICGLVSSYTLERPVFGGSGRQPQDVTFQLVRPATVTVEVLRGDRVVERLGGRTYAAGRTVRLRLAAGSCRPAPIASGCWRSATAAGGSW